MGWFRWSSPHGKWSSATSERAMWWDCGGSRRRRRRFRGVATSAHTQGYIMATDFRRDAPRPRRNPAIRSGVGGIIGAVSGFSSVSCLETWRIPVPRIRDRLHRIEPRSPNSHPGDRIDGLSLALPTVRPGGHIRSGWNGSVASAPRTPWSACALHTGRFLTSAAWFLWNWPQLLPTRRSAMNSP